MYEGLNTTQYTPNRILSSTPQSKTQQGEWPRDMSYIKKQFEGQSSTINTSTGDQLPSWTGPARYSSGSILQARDNSLNVTEGDSILRYGAESTKSSRNETLDSNEGIELAKASDSFVTCVLNSRSMTAKKNDLRNILEIYKVGICLITETWEHSSQEVADFLEQFDYDWHSRPRVTSTWGGGVGVAVSRNLGQSRRLDVPNPLGLEIIWLIVTPRTRPAKRIIVACFYASTSSKYRAPEGAYDRHIVENMGEMRKKFKNVEFVIAGDRNTIALKETSEILEEVVRKPTRNKRRLDVIFTDMDPKGESWTAKGIEPDAPTSKKRKAKKPRSKKQQRGGVPSDHKMAFIRLELPKPTGKWYSSRTRKTTAETIKKLGELLKSEDWSYLDNLTDSNVITNLFQAKTTEFLNQVQPFKKRRLKIGEEIVMKGALLNEFNALGKIRAREGNSVRYKRKQRSLIISLLELSKQPAA